MDRINILKEQYETFGFREFYGWPGWYRAPLEPEADDILHYESINFDEPIPIRRAKILNEIMSKMRVFIKPDGTAFNLRFHPQVFKTETGKQKIIRLIKTLFQMGGMHVQFNVVDQGTLRDAQKHPEKYRDLIVRVTGYSARFVDEPAEIQNNIIAQTEYVF